MCWGPWLSSRHPIILGEPLPGIVVKSDRKLLPIRNSTERPDAAVSSFYQFSGSLTIFGSELWTVGENAHAVFSTSIFSPFQVWFRIEINV